MATLEDSDFFLVNGETTAVTSSEYNSRNAAGSSPYKFTFTPPGWAVPPGSFPGWNLSGVNLPCFESSADGTQIIGGGVGEAVNIIYGNGGLAEATSTNIATDDIGKWAVPGYITYMNLNPAKSFKVKARNLIKDDFKNHIVLLHHVGTNKSYYARIKNLNTIDNSSDQLYMLANKGAVSYKVKLSTVISRYLQRSIIWSDYAQCLNVANMQPIIPPPVSDSGSSRQNVFNGNMNSGWYLYRPLWNGTRYANVRFKLDLTGLGVYCRTLDIKCGWNGTNGRGSIVVNGTTRINNMAGHDGSGTWSNRMTINETLNTIELPQNPGTGNESFGVYSIVVNDVRLKDGDPIPA